MDFLSSCVYVVVFSPDYEGAGGVEFEPQGDEYDREDGSGVYPRDDPFGQGNSGERFEDRRRSGKALPALTCGSYTHIISIFVLIWHSSAANLRSCLVFMLLSYWLSFLVPWLVINSLTSFSSLYTSCVCVCQCARRGSIGVLPLYLRSW